MWPENFLSVVSEDEAASLLLDSQSKLYPDLTVYKPSVECGQNRTSSYDEEHKGMDIIFWASKGRK